MLAGCMHNPNVWLPTECLYDPPSHSSLHFPFLTPLQIMQLWGSWDRQVENFMSRLHVDHACIWVYPVTVCIGNTNRASKYIKDNGYEPNNWNTILQTLSFRFHVMTCKENMFTGGCDEFMGAMGDWIVLINDAYSSRAACCVFLKSR